MKTARPGRLKGTGFRFWSSSDGFTMLEFMVAAIIILALATASVVMISRVEEYAGVAQAKTEITQISMALEMEKYDTGGYSLDPKDLGERDAPGGVSSRLWHGPYLKGGNALDPWGIPYVLARQDMVLSIPAGASTATSPAITFTDGANPDTLTVQAVDNRRVDSVTITVNGISFSTSELPYSRSISTNPNPSGNVVQISLNGESGAGVILTALDFTATARQPYIIISRGADKLPGGRGMGADIIWHSDSDGFQD